ncbi:MAG: peptidoglycan-binding protein [Candidatus Omnitrophica bacterium]|nr:peptidoglycan-binding protein [Candidatus Omnitrophota bacterium]
MKRKLVIALLLGYCVIVLAGCATARKQKELEIQSLKNQISVLKAEIENKDEEISALRYTLTKLSEEKEALENNLAKRRVIGEVKSRPNIRQIQIALRNAGFDPGEIDGKMGRQTRNAIMAFQRANNLVVDGKVGKATWNLLKEYLYKKVK